MGTKDSDQNQLSQLKEQFLSFEKRLATVEKFLEKIETQSVRTSTPISSQTDSDLEISFPIKTKSSIEFGIGEYGMAWLGNIVLLIAIVFFVQHIHKTGSPLLSVLLGYGAISGIYLISYFTSKAYRHLSILFLYSGHLLLFFITLRLHFVSNPVIDNQIGGLIAIIVVLSILFFLAFRKESQLFTGIVLLMMLVAGVISNNTHFLLGISVIAAIASILIYYKFGWIKLVITFIFFIYFTQLMWLLSNPVITHQAQLRETHEYCYIYLIAVGFIFSLLAILPKKEKVSNDILIFTLIWNGLGFTLLLVINVFTYLHENYVLIFGLISFFSLVYSIIIQSRSFLKISASIYSIYGFMAMSVAIYGIFLFPKAYTLLAIQSFLVVSMALWFRSQFIVVMNALLYILLLVFYIKDPESYNSTNFAFMLIAFITARVLNWKKDRLNLKTELLRNLYLISGFIMTLIAFRHFMPESLVTVSWLLATVLFFVLSILLRNIKYRWLAIASLIASATNLIFADMSGMEVSSRIIIFMVLAVVSITVSIFYTKFLAKKGDN